MRNGGLWKRVGALALVTASGMLACGGPPKQPASVPLPNENGPVAGAPQSSEAEEPVDGDCLVARLPSDMPTLNPLTSTDAYGGAILGLVFDTLIERDNTTFEPKPCVAESWEVTPDHLGYTFKLRPGVVFSDGQPLTANDVKFTFDTLKDPAVDAAHLRNYYDNVVSCEVPDPLTVKFTCKEPYFKTLVMLGELPILPQHIYGQGDFNSHPNNRKPIGSGLYTLESWETGLQLTLIRNEKYWGKKPHITKRVYKIITDELAALQVLNKRQLDVIGLAPDKMLPENWTTQTNAPEFLEKFDRYSYYAPSHNYIGWNLRKPLFEDKMVRRALTMLLDRETILQTVFRGLGVVVSGNFYVNGPEYDPSLNPWPFDPAHAKTILAQAGWADTNNDGVLDKNSAPFAFELLFPSGIPEYEQLATVYQEELKKAGISMTIRPLEWATFVDSVHNQRFDACMMGWQLGIDPDPYQIWHSSQAEKGSNYIGFVNDEADKIIEDARKEFDRDKRVAMYRRIHQIQHEEQPYTFLFCTKWLMVLDKRFHGVTMYPLGADTREWWVPVALQRYK
ncbi:MAG TPA: peptide-binding protein [Candidatus Hydrogenedentes bacterium]|nr:peptide-binding protein [Candidatus Hydrogenedentota bacterium]